MKKTCKECGIVFTKPANICQSVWDKRIFCSHSCQCKSHRIEITEKICPQCGNKIKRKKGQSPSSYNRLTFCSARCSAINVMERGENTTFKCGEIHPNFNRGEFTTKHGYVQKLVDGGGYRPEHITIMEEYLGRKLEKGECVHHCDKIKRHNKIDNLELMTFSSHSLLHKCKQLHTKQAVAKAVATRHRKYKNENHPLWKRDVTPERIKTAIESYKTLKMAAESLGICADTLRARIHKHHQLEVQHAQ